MERPPLVPTMFPMPRTGFPDTKNQTCKKSPYWEPKLRPVPLAGVPSKKTQNNKKVPSNGAFLLSPMGLKHVPKRRVVGLTLSPQAKQISANLIHVFCRTVSPHWENYFIITYFIILTKQILIQTNILFVWFL